MATDNSNNLPDFDKPNENTGVIKWMWWLYIAVGLFIVCLLIWMFVALSKHQIDKEQEEPWIEQSYQQNADSNSTTGNNVIPTSENSLENCGN